MNMSYCMYENTAQDLHQVFEDMERRLYAADTSTSAQQYEADEKEEYNEDNAPLSHREESARQDILQMCRDILEMYGEEDFE